MFLLLKSILLLLVVSLFEAGILPFMIASGINFIKSSILSEIQIFIRLRPACTREAISCLKYFPRWPFRSRISPEANYPDYLTLGERYFALLHNLKIYHYDVNAPNGLMIMLKIILDLKLYFFRSGRVPWSSG